MSFILVLQMPLTRQDRNIVTKLHVQKFFFVDFHLPIPIELNVHSNPWIADVKKNSQINK